MFSEYTIFNLHPSCTLDEKYAYYFCEAYVLSQEIILDTYTRQNLQTSDFEIMGFTLQSRMSTKNVQEIFDAISDQHVVSMHESLVVLMKKALNEQESAEGPLARVSLDKDDDLHLESAESDNDDIYMTDKDQLH